MVIEQVAEQRAEQRSLLLSPPATPIKSDWLLALAVPILYTALQGITGPLLKTNVATNRR